MPPPVSVAFFRRRFDSILTRHFMAQPLRFTALTTSALQQFKLRRVAPCLCDGNDHEIQSIITNK